MGLSSFLEESSELGARDMLRGAVSKARELVPLAAMAVPHMPAAATLGGVAAIGMGLDHLKEVHDSHKIEATIKRHLEEHGQIRPPKVPYTPETLSREERRAAQIAAHIGTPSPGPHPLLHALHGSQFHFAAAGMPDNHPVTKALGSAAVAGQMRAAKSPAVNSLNEASNLIRHQGVNNGN